MRRSLTSDGRKGALQPCRLRTRNQQDRMPAPDPSLSAISNSSARVPLEFDLLSSRSGTNEQTSRKGHDRQTSIAMRIAVAIGRRLEILAGLRLCTKRWLIKHPSSKVHLCPSVQRRRASKPRCRSCSTKTGQKKRKKPESLRRSGACVPRRCACALSLQCFCFFPGREAPLALNR